MITAVVSKKGGVGKTTTCVNLAAALAERGQRVLLIDLDPNAGASLSLGLAKSDLGPGAADLLLRGAPAEEVIRSTGVDGLHVVPSSVDLRGAEVELDRIRPKDRVLQPRLEPLREQFDFVFIDCPSSVGLLTRNAIVAADTFLVPAVPHFLAVEGLEHLIDNAERLSLHAGSKTRLLGIVLTLVDYRVRTTRLLVDRLRQRFDRSVFAVEVRTNISLAEAPAFGQNILQYKPRATGARAYRLLADELLQRTAPPPAELPAPPAAAPALVPG